MAGKTPVRNKPIMIYLHPNTEDYDPGAGKSLLVNLGSLDGYQDLLDDCTARMEMKYFATKLFTPNGELIQGLEDVQPKSHLIVVGERESFKVQTVDAFELGADESPQGEYPSPSSDRTATPPSKSPSEREETQDAVDEAQVEQAGLGLSPAEPIDEAPAPSATFRKYDLNNDGVLDKDEVAKMLVSLGYKLTPEYIDGLMESFAEFDANDNEVIDPDEFEKLWEFLGGAQEVEAGTDPSPTAEKQADPLFAEFQKYDSRNCGYLSQYDVGNMMKDMGFKTSDEYVQELMGHFSQADTDGDGAIDFEEFKALHAHLGGTAAPTTVEPSSAENGSGLDSAQDETPEDPQLREKFERFDLNNDGVLSQYEVQQMIQTLGYHVNTDYLAQTMNLFGEFDKDGDKVIQFGEFEELWTHLNAGMPAEQQTEAKAQPLQRQLSYPGSLTNSPIPSIVETFIKYDTKEDSVLDKEEVAAMMADLGYKADQAYIDALFEMYSDYTPETMQHDDFIHVERFEELWHHLGHTEPAPDTAKDTPYRAEFDKYDQNSDGCLSPFELQQMMTDLGYKTDLDYLQQLLSTFGSFDKNQDGMIDASEFGPLWEHLGGHRREGTGEVATTMPEDDQEPERDLSGVFNRFDINKDGALDEAEVKEMMRELGYNTTDEYVQQTMELFGVFDKDDDHLIQLGEFEPLWDHLGGDQLLASQGVDAPEADTSDPLYVRFMSFDLTKSGFLTRHEIRKMMAVLGYTADDNYLNELLELFGSFDTDGDGVVDFEEWKGLWEHLGGEDAIGQVDMVKKSEANAHEQSDPLWKTFKKYDQTGSNSLSRHEVKQMMGLHGYKADHNYMEGLLEIFGKFDSDGDGVFEFNEFCKLWEHLGFEQPIAHAAQPDSDSSERDPEFDKFDLNADGVLSAREITAFMVAHNFQHDNLDEYVVGLIDSFAQHDDQDGDYLTREGFVQMRAHLGV